MIGEYLLMAMNSLRRRKLRSWLTMIGIFIGIAAVVSLISLGQGLEQGIIDEFASIGSDKLFVQPEGSFGTVGDNVANPLTKDDVDFLERQNLVQIATPLLVSSVKVEYQNNIRYFTALGIEPDQQELDLVLDSFYNGIDSGTFLADGEVSNVVLGIHHKTRGLYNGKNVELGSKIKVNDVDLRVRGFIAPMGNNDDDRSIIMPIDKLRELSGVEERVDFIYLQVSGDPVQTAEVLNRNLARFRNVEEGKEDFELQTPEDLLATFETILTIVNSVLIGIAAISLFVGSIGIMNTMYTAVVERRKEIGIMKAIGAKNSDIRMLFLFESGVLGFAGGILGIIIGVSLAKLVEVISEAALGSTFLIAYFSWELFVIALAISTFVGALSGTLPAIQASKLQPVDTLRDE